MNKAVLILALCALAGFSHAEIYSYIDASGQRVFTDQPPGDAAKPKVVELKPTNALPPVPQRLSPKKKTEPKQQALQFYQQLHISSPAHDSTVRANDRILTIAVENSPDLLPGHNYQLWLDGAAFGSPSQSTVWQVSQVDRGSHQLQAHIVDANGQSIAQSEPIQVHVRQTTLADRKRVRPCKADDYGKRLECPLKDKPKKETRPWWWLGL